MRADTNVDAALTAIALQYQPLVGRSIDFLIDGRVIERMRNYDGSFTYSIEILDSERENTSDAQEMLDTFFRHHSHGASAAHGPEAYCNDEELMDSAPLQEQLEMLKQRAAARRKSLEG